VVVELLVELLVVDEAVVLNVVVLFVLDVVVVVVVSPSPKQPLSIDTSTSIVRSKNISFFMI
jgi:hypothetical protein